MKSLLLILLFVCSISVSDCKTKSKMQTNEVKAELTDFTGLDGCGWMIKLETADNNGNQTLMPLNLDDFSIEKTEGKKVLIVYKIEPAFNTCMAGANVRLSSIR